MTYAPKSLRDLGAYWVEQGGVNLGIVGNASHLKGYHLGRDRIYDGAGPGLGDRDYSVQTARDKRGLTDAASAIDLGRLNGRLTDLWEFSRWFAQQCMDAKPGYGDVREVIFWSTSRGRVIGWSALAPDRWINDYGDASHKTHTHISFFRDSEARDKRPLFAPYFAPPVPEDDMPVITTYVPGNVAVIADPLGPANIRSAPSLAAPLVRAVPKGSAESWTVTGWVKGEATGGSDQWICRWANGAWEYTSKVNVAKIGAPPDTSPYTQADVDAAYEQGKADGDVKHTVTLQIDGTAVSTTEV